MKAQGFFPGPRVVVLDGALDAHAPALAAVLADWRPSDARLVVAAGNLAKGSALRKLFEDHPNALAAAIYADPPGRAEVAAILGRAGLTGLPEPILSVLTALAGALDPGDFAQFATKLALYKLDDPTPVSAADISAVAPLTPMAPTQTPSTTIGKPPAITEKFARWGMERDEPSSDAMKARTSVVAAPVTAAVQAFLKAT